MRANENPWWGYDRSDPPDWAMRRRSAPFRVECPECGRTGRPYYCNDGTDDVRCASCNARFSPRGRVPATVTGKGKADA